MAKIKSSIFFLCCLCTAGCDRHSALPQPVPNARSFETVQDLASHVLSERLDEVIVDDGCIWIYWDIEPNFSSLVGNGVRLDIAELLKELSHSDIQYSEIVLIGSANEVNLYGEMRKKRMVMLAYSKPKIERIKWRHFDVKNMYALSSADRFIDSRIR